MIGRKPCILVTGAATPLHRRIRLALRAEGYDVLKASSYSRAIAMTHGYRPDLVLLDMDLPGTMDGFDFCTMIRTDHRHFSEARSTAQSARSRPWGR